MFSRRGRRRRGGGTPSRSRRLHMASSLFRAVRFSYTPILACVNYCNYARNYGCYNGGVLSLANDERSNRVCESMGVSHTLCGGNSSYYGQGLRSREGSGLRGSTRATPTCLGVLPFRVGSQGSFCGVGRTTRYQGSLYSRYNVSTSFCARSGSCGGGCVRGGVSRDQGSRRVR